MTKVVNFKPTREELADLGTEISFTLTNLQRFEGTTTTTNLPEPQFQNLTYEEALSLSKNNGRLFFNSDPNQPSQTRITIDTQNLTPASSEQVLEEIQRVEKIRAQLLNSLSTLTKITIDGYDRLSLISKKQRSLFERDLLDNVPIKLVPMKKSEVIDAKSLFLEYFNPSKVQDRKYFTYFLYSNSSQFWKINSATNTTITLSGVPNFQVGEYITIANLTNSFADQIEGSVRDYLYLKVKEVSGTLITLDASSSFPYSVDGKLLSDVEVDLIQNKTSLMIATRGVPVLFALPFGGNQQGWALSLIEAANAILDETPYTRLYSEKIDSANLTSSFLGNLEKSSLQVTLIDDDKEVVLVRAGEATPGVSINYKLNTDSKKAEFGNVDIRLKLASIPALLRIRGGDSRSLKLDARIKATTAELSAPFSGKTILDKLVTTSNFISQAAKGENDSREFYFNYQATTQKTISKETINPETGLSTTSTSIVEEKIDLYKYGSIRIGETLEVLNQQRQLVQKTTIVGIDLITSTIVLKDPLTTPVVDGFYLRIPQSPLNPGREYRTTISCRDKTGSETAPEMKQFVFKTKRLPQTNGVDGAVWEKLNWGSVPPSLDVSISDSTAVALSASIAQINTTFAGLSNTLLSATQTLQNAACSVGTFAENLKNIQTFADSFAKGQNNTAIYTRAIGLDPIGSIGSQASFLRELQRIVQDTNSQFPLPRLTEAEIPLDPRAIDGVLGGGDALEQILQENAALGGTLGQIFKQVGVGAFAGSKRRKLSNNINFESIGRGGGFPSDTVSYKILTIRRDEPVSTRVVSQDFAIAYIERSELLDVDTITITGSKNNLNNGTFQVDRGFSSFRTFAGKTIVAVRYRNPRAVVEATSDATATFPNQGNITSLEAIRIALEKEGLIGASGKSKFASVKQVLEVLLKYKIIGVNQDLLAEDKSIAFERLSLLSQVGTKRIGGVVLVGKASSPSALAAKLQSVADVIEYLKPLADKIALQAAQLEGSKSGINRDRTEVVPKKLNSANNTALKDVEAVKQKVENSGIKEHKPVTLKSFKENPPPGVYDAWRKYAPVQLIPALKTMGVADLEFDDTIGQGASNFLSKALAPVGSVSETLINGQKKMQTFLNTLDSKAEAIVNITEELNALNELITESTNWLKNIVSRSNISLDGHLIGANLDLATNEDFYNSTISTLNDFTDPNRPTFGPPPSTNFLTSQNRLQGISSGQLEDSTDLWFGIVLIVVGKDRNDLGEQMRFLANILSMDDSKIAIPKKPTITFQGLKA